MSEFLKAFLMIFTAEMGDKSQLLALAFATRYPLKTVLSGVSLGIFLNHGVAILLALIIAEFIPIEYIKVLSGFVFIAFGLNSLILEFGEEEENEAKGNFGPVLTIALSFFLGEFGDKTQLTAMTLAVASERPLLILTATVSSMILVSFLGIIVGKMLGKKIPEFTMKILASIMFIVFGLLELQKAAPKSYLNPISITLFLGILLLCIGLILYRNIKKRDAYYREKITGLIANCRNCTVHNPMCDIAMEINRFTQLYVGEQVPFLGNILVYIEGIRELSPKKYIKMREDIVDKM